MANRSPAILTYNKVPIYIHVKATEAKANMMVTIPPCM